MSAISKSHVTTLINRRGVQHITTCDLSAADLLFFTVAEHPRASQSIPEHLELNMASPLVYTLLGIASGFPLDSHRSGWVAEPYSEPFELNQAAVTCSLFKKKLESRHWLVMGRFFTTSGLLSPVNLTGIEMRVQSEVQQPDSAKLWPFRRILACESAAEPYSSFRPLIFQR